MQAWSSPKKTMQFYNVMKLSLIKKDEDTEERMREDMMRNQVNQKEEDGRKRNRKERQETGKEEEVHPSVCR